ncbi:MAG: hypothetical protein C0522_13655 [Rhodocyclaceae bacterium]|nr:hypothetical protein [Rhodocyclaceae bacterium]
MQHAELGGEFVDFGLSPGGTKLLQRRRHVSLKCRRAFVRLRLHRREIVRLPLHRRIAQVEPVLPNEIAAQ